MQTPGAPATSRAATNTDLALNRPGSAAEAHADEVGRSRLVLAADVRTFADRWAADQRAQAVAARRHFRQQHPIKAFFADLLGRKDPSEQMIQQGWHEIMARTPPMSQEERNFRLGAEGERATGRQLDRLPPHWHVLHSVPVGTRGADIDHVVIGPGGFFTLNTKHHRGSSIWVGGDAFKVGGTWTRYVEKSRYEADRAASLLAKATGVRLPATPVIVVVGARRVTIKQAPEGVDIVELPQLASWLTAQPTLMRPHDADAFFAVARNSSVWS